MNSKISKRYRFLSQTPKVEQKSEAFSPNQRTVTVYSPEKTLRPDHLSSVERIISPFRPLSARFGHHKGFFSKDEGINFPQAKLRHNPSGSRLSTTETRYSLKNESVDFQDADLKTTKRESNNASNLRDSGLVLNEFKRELAHLMNEKKRLVKLVTSLKNNIKMCEADTIRAVHEQERWHNQALKQSRGVEFRTNEKFILDRTKQFENEQIKSIMKELEEDYNNNKRYVSDIESEKNMIIELQNFIAEVKRETAANLRNKEKIRQELVVATKLVASLQQRLEYNQLGRSKLNLCVDDANNKAESLKHDLEDGNNPASKDGNL